MTLAGRSGWDWVKATDVAEPFHDFTERFRRAACPFVPRARPFALRASPLRADGRLNATGVAGFG